MKVKWGGLKCLPVSFIKAIFLTKQKLHNEERKNNLGIVCPDNKLYEDIRTHTKHRKLVKTET